MWSLQGNWVDLIIIFVLVFFIHQGIVSGFWSILIDFVSFFGSLLVSLRIYPFASSLLQSNFSFSRSLGNAIGFLILAVIFEILISFLLARLIQRLPRKVIKNKLNRVLGIILSIGQGIILIAFALTLIISLPISPKVKTDISNSKIGSFILRQTTGVEKAINNIFGGAINESLTYLTVEPKSKQSVPLDKNQAINLTVDSESEEIMLKKVNDERISRGLTALKSDKSLVEVSRSYAKKMWEEHYFGHYDEEGNDVGDRLQSAKIIYSVAGENLALSPTVEIAHNGLMNSPGHKANILDEEFRKVGIGVVDNGFYGKMFVQVFTN